MIEKIKVNPLTRALRIDKLTLAALEATLKLYRDEKQAVKKIPTLRMLTMSFEETCLRAAALEQSIKDACGSHGVIALADLESRPGGGSFPALRLPTRCVTLKPDNMSVAALERRMRLSCPAIIARIENNMYIMDPRTIQPGQETIISSTLKTILAPE